MMKGRRFLALGGLFLLVFGLVGSLWALYADYNRLKPLMDYVPQEIGIYDTVYEELTESDCRSCHGNSLAERHHATSLVIDDGLCTPCHEVIEDDPGVVVIRDCLTSGCHSWDDVTVNGWHHLTDLSDSQNCIACHSPNLIAEITPFRDLETYPPSVVTPTPFSCENCHWEQLHSATGDPENPGHPSTYDHYNFWGDSVGFHEYSKPIFGNFDTHHMGSFDKLPIPCSTCHSLNPNDPSWNHDNPELIRYCEICHDVATLHTIAPHVQATAGWEAVGFHVPISNTDPTDVDPTVYRTFTQNEMCFGCHGDDILDPTPPPVIMPSISTIEPTHGNCGAIVTLRGENFGQEHEEGYDVWFNTGGESLAIYSWTNTRIEFYIPCRDVSAYPPGNYEVRVQTPAGYSNAVNFTVENHLSVSGLSPEAGECRTWIRISGLAFGESQSKMFNDDYGVHHVVDFVSSQGTFTALNYKDWTNNSFKVQFNTFFEDELDPLTGQRNFVQDEGEPTVTLCHGLFLGPWAVYVKAIFFGDDDSGGLSYGDTIFQVVLDDPEHFELALRPSINALNPTKIENHNLLHVLGLHFGPSQKDGEVRFGTESQALDPALGQGELLSNVILWSNTMILVQVNVTESWEGNTGFVWVEKNSMKSNYRSLEILLGVSADSDGDGVLDSADNCPNTANSDQADSDGDGFGDACDTCPSDPNKTEPGTCGCGVADTDSDSDGTPDCNDGCPNDPNKTEPGTSGCGTPEPAEDSDGDGIPDTEDNCPNTANSDQADSDGDGFGDACDTCPSDPNKTEPGTCGCGVADTDSDSDGTPDCNDGCPNDPNKTEPGACGCGVADTDTDGDGTADCNDSCPEDPNKVEPGACGCGTADTDSDNDGIQDCIEDAAPNGGDGNNDGTPDKQQNNVVSLRTNDGKLVTLVVPNPATLSDCGVADNPSPDDAPEGVGFTYGFFSFTINNVSSGGAIAMTLRLHDGTPPTTYFKYGPEPGDPTDHWYEFKYDALTETGAVINGNEVTLHFVDGQRGDDFPNPDGMVVDQGGPGFTSTATTSSGVPSSRGGGGSCFINTAFGSFMAIHQGGRLTGM